jgi:hypothetical protein
MKQQPSTSVSYAEWVETHLYSHPRAEAVSPEESGLKQDRSGGCH